MSMSYREGELPAVVVHAAGVHQAQHVPHVRGLQHLQGAEGGHKARLQRTFSPVVGQMPPLARVAPITATVSVLTWQQGNLLTTLTSRLHDWK